MPYIETVIITPTIRGFLFNEEKLFAARQAAEKILDEVNACYAQMQAEYERQSSGYPKNELCGLALVWSRAYDAARRKMTELANGDDDFHFCMHADRVIFSPA